MKDSARKIEMYQVLHIMLNEQNMDRFEKILLNFSENYKISEPAFHKYFEEYYTPRTGKLNI